MKDLRAPVKDVLRKTTTAASVTRMWGRIEARGRARARGSAPRRGWLLLVAAAVATSVAFGGVTHVWRPRSKASDPAVEASRAIPPRPATAPGATLAATPAAETAGVPATPSPAAPSGLTVTMTPRSRSASSRTETWKQLAARGENAKAYDQLGPAGLADVTKSASVGDLFALADVARLSGHPADARAPLERIVAESPTDARASLAALTLGRIQLRSLGAPAAAAASLEKALGIGLPAGLDQDAYGLLIESRATAGDRAGARVAYEQYRARFPQSAAGAELQRWVSGP
jgi:transmembrane sensor